MLLNVGFTEASRRRDHECYFFHDVDLLPESDSNSYSCPDQPRHASAAINTMSYKSVMHMICLSVPLVNRPMVPCNMHSQLPEFVRVLGLEFNETHSTLLHSRLKTHLFHKSFPP